MGSDLFPLSSITTKITKGTTPTSIGSSFTEHGINFVKSESITGARNLDRFKFSHIDMVTHNRLLRSQLETNDILFSMAGVYLGKTAIVTEKDIPANTNQAVAIIRVDTTKADFNYVYYWLSQRQVTESVNAACAQSAQPNINLAQIGSILIRLPSIEDQQSIAATLSCLDDKIELNNRIIANLEAQVQAIFVDIFQDDDSAIELGSVCATTSGGTPSRTRPEYFGGNIPWVKSKEINGSFLLSTEETVTEEAIAASSAKILPLHSTLIAMYGATVGEYCVTTTEMACNQAICAIIPNEVYSYEYLFQVAKNNRDNLKGLAIGSAQQNINQQTIRNLVISNDTSKIEAFHDITSPIFACIENKCRETIKLVETRDTLLPKLMSGEIEVPVNT